MTSGEAWVLAPLACLIGGAFAVYLLGRFITSRNEVLALFTACAFAASLASIAIAGQRAGAAHRAGAPVLMWGYLGAGGAYLSATRGGLMMGGIASALGLCVAIYSGRYLGLDRRYKVYYPLLLMMTTGLTGMVMAADLFSLYMFCELMSIAAYVLVAFRRQTDTAIEAGFKYLVMGTLGTMTLLFGIALIFRETGVLLLGEASGPPGTWARVGMACLLVGLGVKSAVVPMHTWLPDAHGRAPSSVSAMLSGIVIQASLYTLISSSISLGFPSRSLGSVLMAVSLLNMTVGNGLALVQANTKRLLAYSTIAQMGYAMFSIGVGLRHGIPDAVQAGFFLMLVHAAMKALAFLSKGICHFYRGTTMIAELRGTYQHLPLVAATFTVALVGLAGVPPMAGFAGKWLILAEVLRTGDWAVYVGAGVFLLNTLVSLGYYVPVIAMLFTPESGKPASKPIAVSAWMAVPLIGLTLVVVILGIAPGPWLGLVQGLLAH